MSYTSDPGKRATFFIAFFICLVAWIGDGAAQARFKTKDDSLSKEIRANEQHKLAGIERLVEATRSYENLDKDKAYTILAPNNLAFRKLPVQMIDYLIDPAHESELNELLSCHTLIGKFSEKQIRNHIEKAGGKAAFSTLAGFVLTATTDKDNAIIFIDKFKRKIKLLEGNYRKGDFPVHIIDGVILPYNAVY